MKYDVPEPVCEESGVRSNAYRRKDRSAKHHFGQSLEQKKIHDKLRPLAEKRKEEAWEEAKKEYDERQLQHSYREFMKGDPAYKKGVQDEKERKERAAAEAKAKVARHGRPWEISSRQDGSSDKETE